MINLDTPNLDDGFTAQELQQLASVYSKLSDYCTWRALAKLCRLKGNIVMALHYEGCCERLYQQLPADARW